ncbi:MAG: hypothetical protein UE295_10850, partial [Acutalibacteraceae bacterium]|nr:hypothetical protein [Acutalibacteraceae bacterium]
MKCERCGYENFSESHYCRKCWAELHKLDGEGGDSELSRYKNRGNYQPSYNCKKDLYDGNNRYIRGLYNLDTNNNYTGANSQYSSAQNVPYNNGVNNNQQSQTRQYPETASTQYDNNGYSEDNFSATD